MSAARRRRRQALRRAIKLGAVALAVALMVLADRVGLFGRGPESDSETYNRGTFRVTHVVDGDTLDVDTPDTLTGRATTRVRLWGVDTPETVKPGSAVEHFGPEASDFTERLCQGKTVRLELVAGKTRGKYGRLLAYVTLPDGKMLNAELIERGFGYADPRFTHPRLGEFGDLQRKAMRGRKGLWKNVRPDDLPYYYRTGPHKLTLP